MAGLSKRNSILNIILNFYFMICSVICIFPILLVLGVSFSDEKSILRYGYSVIPAKFTLNAYDYLFKYVNIVSPYILTLFVTLAGMFFSTVIIALYAYPLSRKEFRYRSFFSFFIFFTMIFNGGLVPWYIVCVQIIHINNTIFALILPYLINAWYVIIMRTFFITNVPDEIIDSARVDGSKELFTFFKIVLPIALPGLATIALFTTLAYWNDWWLPFILVNNQSLYNIQFTIYRALINLQFITQNATLIGNSALKIGQLPGETARMAMCIVAIGPIVLAYPFFQKYFVKGLTVGSLKG